MINKKIKKERYPKIPNSERNSNVLDEGEQRGFSTYNKKKIFIFFFFNFNTIVFKTNTKNFIIIINL